MSAKEANLVAVLSLVLMLLIWLIGFRGVLDFTVGAPREATGRITSCEESGKDGGLITWKKKRITLYLDSLPSGVAFTRPPSARVAVRSLCERRAGVRILYDIWKPPLSGSERYRLRGVTDVDTDTVVFTPGARDGKKRSDRRWACGLFGFAGLSLLYAVGVRTGILSGKGKEEYRQDLRHGFERGQFIIRSRQRRGEAFAYLILFSGIAGMFGYLFLAGRLRSWWVPLPFALFLAAAYAYLMEVVNVSELTFDNGDLLYKQTPLPWFGRRLRVPVEHIAEVLAEERTERSSHGPYTLTSVSLRHRDGETTTLFFTNSLAEAQAIAELTNRHLADRYRSR